MWILFTFMGIIMRQASAWDITSIFGLLQSWDCHWMMIFHHYPIIPHRVRSPKNRLHHSRGPAPRWSAAPQPRLSLRQAEGCRAWPRLSQQCFGLGNSKFMVFRYPLVIEHSYWKWPFIVDLSIKMMIFHSYVSLPEGNLDGFLGILCNLGDFDGF